MKKVCVIIASFGILACAPKAPVGLIAPLRVAVVINQRTVAAADGREAIQGKIALTSWMKSVDYRDGNYDYIVVVGHGRITSNDMMTPDGLTVRRGTLRSTMEVTLYAGEDKENPLCYSWASVGSSFKLATKIAWRDVVEWLQRFGVQEKLKWQ